MVSVTKSNRDAAVVVYYDVEECFHKAIITKYNKKGPTIITFHSSNPVKLLDAIKTETGSSILAGSVMRLYWSQLKGRCSEIVKELSGVNPAIKAMAPEIEKEKAAKKKEKEKEKEE